MADRCVNCEGGDDMALFDGETPRGTPCCETCWRCEVCGCACPKRKMIDRSDAYGVPTPSGKNPEDPYGLDE